MLRLLRTTLLVIVATAGLLTVVGVLATALFGVGFGVVATGSMAPSIPTGSMIVTVPAAAADVRIGDVVSVPREGLDTTVTHRVVAIAPITDRPDARALTLRGDANTIDDPEPYPVDRVDRVVASAPVIGGVIWSLRNPVALGIGTVLLTALVLSAFWPSREQQEAARQERSAR